MDAADETAESAAIAAKKHIINRRLDILVKPNAAENKIVRWDESRKRLRVEISAAADKNKANKEILRFFSRLFKKRAEIIKGLHSREKTIGFF